MSRLPASVFDSCAPLSISILESTDDTACCPPVQNDYMLPVGSAVLAYGAQAESQDRPPSATKNIRVIPFCCNTPTTCDATPVEDTFEKRHAAKSEARTAELKTYLDKIDQESYRSIQCLRSALQQVDRMIRASSPNTLSPFTFATRRQDAVSQCQSTARRFFYNRGFNRGNNRCLSFPFSSPYGSVVSDPRIMQSDACSVPSTSVSTTSFLLRRSPDEKQVSSRRNTLVLASNSAHLAPLQHSRSSVPRKLETVFAGFSTIKHNSRKICSRLHHAKRIIARLSLEARTSPKSNNSVAEGADAECVTMRKARCFELLDDLDYSVKTAERLHVQVEQLEQKSRRRLNEVYEEMLVRQKFKLSPWRRRVKRPSPFLLRAFSGLKNVPNAQGGCLTSAGDVCAPAGHKPSTYALAPRLSNASTTFSAGATDRADLLHHLSTITGRERIINRQKKVSDASFPLYKNGWNSTHCYSPDTATLESPLKTSHHKKAKSTRLSDVRIPLHWEAEENRRHKGHAEKNASPSPYCSSIPEHSLTPAKSLSAASSIFTSSWSKDTGAVGSSLRPVSRRLGTGQEAPQESHHLNRQRNSSCPGCHTFGTASLLKRTAQAPCRDPPLGTAVSGTTSSYVADSPWCSRSRFRHSQVPLVHARYNATDNQWNPGESNRRCSGSALSTLPQSALCLGCERRSRLLPGVPLTGSGTRDSCQSLDQHNVVREFPFSKVRDAGDRAFTIVSHSHVCSPLPVEACIRDEPSQQRASDISPRQYPSTASPVRGLQDCENRGTKSLSDCRLELQRHVQAPCDLSQKAPEQDEGLSHTAFPSVSCRLLPSPSPSVEHASSHNKDILTEEKTSGTYFSELVMI